MTACRCLPFRFGAVALVGAGLLLPSLLPAQQLRFQQKKYRANPGDTVELRLLAEGAGEISGVNFTLRISAEDATHVLLDEATSFSTQPGATFRYADHRLTRTGIDTGLVRGDVAELRGVLYSHRETPATINTSTAPRHVASIFLPVGLEASGRVYLELVEDDDNGVALLGMADAEGNGIDQVRGDMATIVIERVGVPRVTDFRQPRFWPGWRFIGEWPETGPDPRPLGETIPGEGLVMRSLSFMSVGWWEHDFQNLGTWNSPASGNLLVTDWEMASTHSGPDNPPLRLRQMTSNSMDVTELLLQDFNEDPFGISATPTPQGRTYRTIMQVPPHAANNTGFDGLNTYMDLLGLAEFGQRPGQLKLRRMIEREFDPALLRGRRTDYYQNFGTRDGGGWQFESGMEGGIEATFSRGRNGLGITSGGRWIDDPSTLYGQRFSAGFWFAPFEVVNVKADPNRWYRVEAEVFGTVEDPANAPFVRLRAFPQGNQLFFAAQHYPGIDTGDDYIDRVDADGKTMTMWFQVPNEWAGMPITLAFDMYQLGGADSGPDVNPSVYMRWIRLTSFDKPQLSPAPAP